MRHSKTEKANTHKAHRDDRGEKIPGGRARRDRNRGCDEESWPYRGRLYKHIKSREALVAEGIGRPWNFGNVRWTPRPPAALRSPTSRSSIGILNETRPDHPGVGCAVGALARDLARTSKRTRAVVTKRFETTWGYSRL